MASLIFHSPGVAYPLELLLDLLKIDASSQAQRKKQKIIKK